MTLRNHIRLMIEGKDGKSSHFFWGAVLGLLSLFYKGAIRIRKMFYDVGLLKPKRLPIPVVSIGNVTWGGVGKTPLTICLSRFFLGEQKTPLILTRGYGSDETREFQAEVPQAVLGVGKDRCRVGSRLLKERSIHVALLDDGFQHWQLHRDLEIVVVSALNPFGNGKLIPAGILRESPASLKRADIIIFSDVNLIPRKGFDDLKSKVRSMAPRAELMEAQREPIFCYWARSKQRMELGRLRGKRATTFSGVGTPRSFQLLLSGLGVKTIRNFEFCDHHFFTEREIRNISEVKESSQSDFVVTTEKDFLRRDRMIADILNPLILKTTLRITVGDSILKDRLRKILSS